MKHTLVLRCAGGHEQRIEYDARYSRDEVVAHGVLLAGGRLKGVDVDWPGRPCAVDATEDDSAPCGAALSFSVEDR